MSEYDFSWIPDSYSLDPKRVLRMLYAMRDYMCDNQGYTRKILDVHAFSRFVDKFEEVIRNDVYDQVMPQIPVIDFEAILAEENNADNT